MNTDEAQRLLDDAHSADVWDETCSALSWALAARSALARVEALRDHYAEIGQQAFTRDGTIHTFTDVADDLSEALGDEPSAYRAALAPSPAEPGGAT